MSRISRDPQLALQFQHRARRSDPPTSHVAAAGSSMRTARYARVLEALGHCAERGGTCYELARMTGMTHVEVARCMKPMESRELIRRTEDTRIGDTGYPCTVWRKR